VRGAAESKVCVGCRGEGDFTVQERGSLALTRMLVQSTIRVLAGGSASLSACTLEAEATIDLRSLGSLSLASMAVPAVVLRATENALIDRENTHIGVSRTLRLDAVSVPESPTPAALMTGVMSVAADGSKSIDPQGYGIAPTFTVTSSPCMVSDGGRCVGRAVGYGPNERCVISFTGGGGLLAPCAVFDTDRALDVVTLPDGAGGAGARPAGWSSCPEGVALAPGDVIVWYSDGSNQGNNVPGGCVGLGYDDCGLPYSSSGLGGGWELCFA
jgi:hypothetical protein